MQKRMKLKDDIFYNRMCLTDLSDRNKNPKEGKLRKVTLGIEIKMRLGITDLSDILGITTSAIRYFETNKLIPSIKMDAGKRYYDEEDLFRLLSYYKYRSMKMPMKMILSQFEEEYTNWKTVANREEEYMNRAYEKAAYYQKLADTIKLHIESINQIPRLLNQFEFCQCPFITIAQEKKYGWCAKNKKDKKIIETWVAQMPFVRLCVVENKMQGPSFGYQFQNMDVHMQASSDNFIYHTIEQTSCIHSIMIGESDFSYHPQEIFSAMEDYAKRRGLVKSGMAFGTILLVEVEKGKKRHPYIELWMPVS